MYENLSIFHVKKYNKNTLTWSTYCAGKYISMARMPTSWGQAVLLPILAASFGPVIVYRITALTLAGSPRYDVLIGLKFRRNWVLCYYWVLVWDSQVLFLYSRVVHTLFFYNGCRNKTAFILFFRSMVKKLL